MNLDGQYSNYYNVYSNRRVSGNINVNKNINVTGQLNKTITTIDYGALAAANAQNEANRIQNQRLSIEKARFKNELEKEQALKNNSISMEISKNPIRAFDYGEFFTVTYRANEKGFEFLKQQYGCTSFTYSTTDLHKSLFTSLGNMTWQNVSTSGIRTEYQLHIPHYDLHKKIDVKHDLEYESRVKELFSHWLNSSKPKRKDFTVRSEYKKALEKYKDMCDMIDDAHGVIVYPKDLFTKWDVGSKIANVDGDSVFLHKKTKSKRRVFGNPGYVETLIWEDDYEYGITDNYFSMQNGIRCYAKVRYKADKNGEITYEDIEGRRFYLKPLIDKLIASSGIRNFKYITKDSSYPKRRDYDTANKWLTAVNKWYDLQ